MKKRFGPLLCLTAALAACGGGGGGGDSAPPVVITPPPGTGNPPPPTAACSLRSRIDWAAARMREDYLNPQLLADVDPTGISSVDDFLDAMTAPARAAGKDRPGFSYVVSIAQENALISRGATAGFGIRLRLSGGPREGGTPYRLFVSEAFEGAPALAQGIDRGTEILAIGSTAGSLQTIDAIMAQSGDDPLAAALGPGDPGVSRTFRLRSLGGTESVVTVTKASFALDPVSNRYGVQVLDDGGRRVGYLNLRTFISQTAEADLRDAFATFRSQGITEVIVDLRYNGGGLVSIGELLANLLSAQRTQSEVMSRTVHNQRRSAENTTEFFRPQPQSIAATRIAFIGTKATASASELVMNSLIPYLGANVGLVGDNTFGKPVGQEARDRPECDDRLRVMSFQTVNRDNQGDFFGGLAASFQRTCRASDDLSRPLGDPQEASVRAALDFLAGRACTPIQVGASAQALAAQPRLVRPAQPSAAQRDVPGLF